MKSPFVVGVTGHMDLRDVPVAALRWRVECSLRFLLSAPSRKYRLPNDFYSLFQVPPGGAPVTNDKSAVAEALKNWPEFNHTPLQLLTSLAPGADSLVASVALRLKAEGLPIEVIAPLPFPHQLYQRASTFPNDKSRREYLRLLEEVGTENTFCVRLARDEHLNEKALLRQCEKELEPGCLLRRDRYRAAGVYIADYSHLLLTIWDEHHDANTAEGTAAIVHSRIAQVPFDVLPNNTGLNIPNGGPVLHLRTHREKNRKAEQPVQPPSRFLHCDIFRDRTGDMPPNEVRVQSESLSVMCGVAASLEGFNTEVEPTPERTNKKLTSFFSVDEAFSAESPNQIISMYNDDWRDRFYRLVNLRTRATTANYKLDDASSRAVLSLFVLAFLTAAALHPFFSWATEPPPADNFSWIRMSFSVAVLILSFSIVVRYIRTRTLQRQEKGQDYRALAEGLRVQIFWCLAGLGQSVPANYLQRQRSELDWVRAAIREAAAPYDYWKNKFNRLGGTEKLLVLKCVQKNWVLEQATYFKDKERQNRDLLLGWRKLGVLLAAGALMAVLGLAVVMWSERNTVRPLPCVESDTVWKMLLWAFILSSMTVAVSACRKLLQKCRVNTVVTDSKYCFFAWLNQIIYTEELHDRHGTSVKAKRVVMVFNALSYALLGAVLAIVVFIIAFASSSIGSSSPPADVWLYIFIGITVLAGASCLAWSEKKMYSELAYQYNTMVPLFVYANTRLCRLIDEYAQLHHNVATDDVLQTKLAEIHGLLYELGLEALDENAEWLLMHRARPMIPVVPN